MPPSKAKLSKLDNPARITARDQGGTEPCVLSREITRIVLGQGFHLLETKIVTLAKGDSVSGEQGRLGTLLGRTEAFRMEASKELNGNKAVGIDKARRDEHGRNLDENLELLVSRLKRKKYKPIPAIRVYIPKSVRSAYWRSRTREHRKAACPVRYWPV